MKPQVPKFDESQSGSSGKNSPNSLETRYHQKDQRLKNKFRKLTSAFEAELKTLKPDLVDPNVEVFALLLIQNPQVMKTIKGKKFQMIAQISIAHSIGSTGSVKNFKEYIQSLNQENCIITHLRSLQNQGLVDASYIDQYKIQLICDQMKLDSNYTLICHHLYKILKSLDLNTKCSDDRVICAVVIKLAGDFLCLGKNGANSNRIINHTLCNTAEFFKALNIIINQSQSILTRLVEYLL